MKHKILLCIGVVGLVCTLGAAFLFAQEKVETKYFVGKVVGLNAVDNTLTINEYNSRSPIDFKFTKTGLPQQIFLGDEVIVFADKNNEAREIRLIGQKDHVAMGPISRIPRGRGRRLPVSGNISSEEWDPFMDISRLQDEMTRMFQSTLQPGGNNQGLFNSNMSFDKDFQLEDTGDEYIIRIDMAGLDKDNIEISIDKNSITLKGQSDIEKQENNQNGSSQYRSFGTFLKTIPLPSDADSTGVETKQNGDEMIVRIPKKE